MSEIRKLLNSNIPQEAVETREAWRGGPTLSYLSGAYVINRLNEVLGQGKWGYNINSLNKVFEGTISQTNGEVFTTSYIVNLGFYAMIDGDHAQFDEVGYGDGTDKKSQGKAHELATKEAVTDALKRAAKNLGISMGLGLYFKSGEYVDETVQTEPKKREETKADTKAKPVSTTSSSNSSPKSETQQTPKESRTTNTKILRDQIKNSFAVLQAKKAITKEDFVKNYLEGVKTDDLEDETVRVVLEKINKNFAKELGLN